MDKSRNHHLSIGSFIRRLVEFQVEIQFTHGAFWYDFIAVHQRVGVGPAQMDSITIRTVASNTDLILPVVVPQLAVTGNQVDPLTRERAFFFQCKNMDGLMDQWTKTRIFLGTHKMKYGHRWRSQALPLCSAERKWWPCSDEDRDSRRMKAGTAKVEACSERSKDWTWRTEPAAQPLSVVLPTSSS